MDVKKERRSSKFTKKTLYLAVTVFSVISIGSALATIDFSAKRVDRKNLVIGTVEAGNLDITVSSNGTLKSRNIEWLTSQVNGRVSKVFVQPGDSVKVGQVLLKLSNPAVLAAADEAFAAWEGAMAKTVSTKVNLERDILNQESVVTRAKFAAEKTDLDVIAYEELGDASPAITLRKAKLSLAQQRSQHEIEKKKYDKLAENSEAIIAVNVASAEQLEKVLGRARQKVEELSIVAGLDGIVQEMPYKIGQQVQPGVQLGKIAQFDELYSELSVPALRSSEIQIGQRVRIDTRVGFIEGVVARVDPTVMDGNVTVDVDLEPNSQLAIRPGLPIEGVIYTAELNKVLFVDKPAFVRANNDASIYLLDKSQNYAFRTNIKVGKVSINQVEVLAGLTVGDQIILSDSSAWQDSSKILLD